MRTIAATDIPFVSTDTRATRWEFSALPGGGYYLEAPDDGVRLEVRHLRRAFQQLHGEVDVRVNWDVPTCDGSLSCADLNLSSQRDRTGRADYCAKRGKFDFDWHQAIDTLCQRTIRAERQTNHAIVLDDAPAENPPEDFHVFGLSIPADSHSQIITDGGGLKSMILLLILGTLAGMGIPVLYLDWEWNATRHKARKRRMFGSERIEHLHYLRCRNPLTIEKDHIRRTCDEKGIAFIGLDSIGGAVDGKLADDDVARAYNRALDDLPPSLAAAHIPKSTGDNPQADAKAFGSAFFHNFARCTWSLRKESGANKNIVTVVLTAQKENDGARRLPVALEFTFSPESIDVRNVDATTVEGYTKSLALNERIARLVSGGPMTIAAIAKALDSKPDSVTKALKRGLGERFTLVSGEDRIDRYALLDRWSQ